MTEGWVGYLTGPYGFAFAFAAGLLSFLSPCVLPLVPAYLAHLTGTAASIGEGAGAARRTLVAHAAAFVGGFTVVFVVLGASVGLLSALVSSDHSYFIQDHKTLLGEIGGVFLIVLGLNLIGVIRIPLLVPDLHAGDGDCPRAGDGDGRRIERRRHCDRGARRRGGDSVSAQGWPHLLAYGKSFGVGSAFAIGWTPCIGPVLGAILTLSASTASVAKGGYLLLVYSLGLGVPFIITALAVVPITRFLRSVRGLMPIVEIVTGVLVIFVGILVFRGELATFNGYFSDIPGLDQFNNIYASAPPCANRGTPWCYRRRLTLRQEL